MKRFILIALILTASAAIAGTNITGQFSVDGTSLKQHQSGELYADPAVVTVATDATVTTNNNTFKTYTASARPTFNNYSVNTAVCWKANGTISYCQTTPTDGKCTCK